MNGAATDATKQRLAGMRVALVGGAGFIGHHLALALAEAGAEPHVVDGLQVNNLGFYSSNYRENPNAARYIDFINNRLALLRTADVPLHVIDVRDYHLTSRVLASIEPHSVIHLAAVAHANRSNKDPYSTFDHSLRTLENVLDALRATDAHVVYFSSSLVYGQFGNTEATEDRLCEPLGIYGALKFAAEKLVIAYNQVFGLPYTIIRPSALYGARCVSRRVGQAFIENALTGQDLTINGDGSDALDFTYVGDLVDGILRVLSTPEARGEVFNLTYGKAQSINEMAQIVQERFPASRIIYNPRDALMPERGTLSIDKARSILDYSPHHDLRTGFLRYLDWYKSYALEHPALFAPAARV
jgi:nucleoside-diphosphate-sugar epimerase